jgi:hypothetical protein
MTPGTKRTAPKEKRPLRLGSGQVQGGNAQEGRRLRGRTRNTAPQQNRRTWFPLQVQKRRPDVNFLNRIKVFYTPCGGFYGIQP